MERLDPVRPRTDDREAAVVVVGDDVAERRAFAHDLGDAGTVGRTVGDVDEQDARTAVGERLGEHPRPGCAGGEVLPDGGEPEVEGGARDLDRSDRDGEVAHVGGGRDLRQECDELAAARAHVARTADAHVERVEREREGHPDGQRGDGDQDADEGEGWDDSGRDRRGREREARQRRGDHDGETTPPTEDVEELDGPQRGQRSSPPGRGLGGCAVGSAEGGRRAAHRRRSLPAVPCRTPDARRPPLARGPP